MSPDHSPPSPPPSPSQAITELRAKTISKLHAIIRNLIQHDRSQRDAMNAASAVSQAEIAALEAELAISQKTAEATKEENSALKKELVHLKEELARTEEDMVVFKYKYLAMGRAFERFTALLGREDEAAAEIFRARMEGLVADEGEGEGEGGRERGGGRGGRATSWSFMALEEGAFGADMAGRLL